MSAFNIGIAGLGTVGAAVGRLLHAQAALLQDRAGRPLNLAAVSSRDRAKQRGFDHGVCAWHDDPRALAEQGDLDLLVETIGGTDGIALETVERALTRGCHVVTANKALLAVHGERLGEMAAANGAQLSFEAAVAGGVPILKALREGLSANQVRRVYGILNGTCNYILTTMRRERTAFADVLKDAQDKGYAETDPSFDIDGIDSAHKLALLAALAFQAPPNFDGVVIEGIREIDATDIAFADEFGLRIKLLGVAALTEYGLEQRVQPCLVPASSPIAAVEGVTNAVVVQGDAVGQVMLQGPGAGGDATASAIIADIVDVAAGRRYPPFGVRASRLTAHQTAPLAAHTGRYYIRLMVTDQPGVLADIAAVLRDHAISIESLVQRGRDPGNPVAIVLTVHPTDQAAMSHALGQIEALEVVQERPRLLPIESFV